MQNPHRRSADIVRRYKLCKRAIAGLGDLEPQFQAQYPDRDVLNGGALTPAGRMGLELPGGAAPVFGPRNIYDARGSAAALSCAQRYRSYDPASGTFLGHDGRRHSCE